MEVPTALATLVDCVERRTRCVRRHGFHCIPLPTSSCRENLKRGNNKQTRASDSRENRQKAFSLKLNWYIIFDKKIEVTNVQVPMLLVVSSTRKMNFPCTRSRLRTWSREAGCGSPVQRQPAYLHTKVESGAYLRDSSRVLRRVHFMIFPLYGIGTVPSVTGHAITYRWRSLPRVRRHWARKAQDSSKRALPWQVTMDQLMCASLSIGVPAYGQTG